MMVSSAARADLDYIVLSIYISFLLAFDLRCYLRSLFSLLMHTHTPSRARESASQSSQIRGESPSFRRDRIDFEVVGVSFEEGVVLAIVGGS